MKNENSAFDIILSPVITEKSTNLNALNKLTFKVSKDANKSSIKKSIEHKTTIKSGINGPVINAKGST